MEKALACLETALPAGQISGENMTDSSLRRWKVETRKVTHTAGGLALVPRS